jgi:flagellin-like protein
LNKILRSKKGISPILATLLLIVIAVAAVIVTYAWVMTFTTTTTSQAGAVLIVENTRYYPSGSTNNKTDIVIRNTGTSDAKLVAVYWSSSGYSSLAPLTSGTHYTFSTTTVSAGNYATVLVTWTSSAPMTSTWTSGNTYYWKIVTEAGQYLQFTAKAP